MKTVVAIPKVQWIALAGAVASLCALYSLQELRRRRRRRGLRKNDDLHYLAICHKLRLALSKPRHSNFRVVAMLLLENDATIMGANDEGSPTISGAICAERGALMQYRILYGGNSAARGAEKPPRVDAVYIVSDHPTIPITPGCLCREYLYGHPAIDLEQTRVILQCADLSPPETWTLPQLYPFASPTARLPRQCAMETSQAYEETIRSLMSQPFPPFDLPPNELLPWTTVQQVYNAACTAARNFDTHDIIYPIRFAAAASVCHGPVDGNMDIAKLDIATAVQVPALEYGCTQDVVCQVLRHNEKETTSRRSIIFVVQVDQWGLPHAPFAVARNALCEPSEQQCTCFVLVGLPLRIVPGIDLYPTLPTIF